MPATSHIDPEEVGSVAVVGTGSVGASWAALFLAHGMSVIAHDPSPGAEQRAGEFITHAWAALVELGVARTTAPPFQNLRFVPSAAEAARRADIVQENVPEKPDLKARVFAEVDAAATPDKIIMSSTGGIPPSELQEACAHPERVVVVHPFNPAHLMPLVEVVGGERTSPDVVQWAMAFARRVGKHPIRVNTETSGHMTNRLQFALIREAVHCLLEGVASASDIDAAVRYGLGPRWTLMGSLLTLHLAGGQGGMKGILDHADTAIEEWWTPRGELRLTPEIKARLVMASEEIADGKPVAEWVAWRDEQLVELMKLQAAGELRKPKRMDDGSTAEGNWGRPTRN